MKPNNQLIYFRIIRYIVSIAAVVFLPCTQALADTVGQTSEPYSFYMISCGNYIEHRTSDKNIENDTADTFYVAGWISAYNRVTPNARNISQDTDLDSILLWLEKYCRDNPLSNLESGLYRLSIEQHPK
jgi:hypothetical protein